MKKKSMRQMLAGVLAVVLMAGNLSIFAGAASADPAPSLAEPKIEIQGNVVRDQFGKLTGFFELGIFMQTMPGQSVQSVMLALEYDPALRPVTWDAAPDKVTGEVSLIDLAGTDDYMVQLPGKKTDGITAAVALTGDKQGAGEVGTEGKSLLYFRAESQKSIVLPELTQLAVIRFHVAKSTMEKFKLSDDGELTYDGGVGNLETFVDFTTEAAAAQSPALRTLHCVCNDFEYVKTAAAGYKTLDPASIALTLVSNESFSKTGIDIDKLCVITYTDWDGTTLGTQVVPQNADVRKMVNDYVKTNFIHPGLQSNENYDSLARADSYRGKYPHVGPGNGNEFPDLLPDGTANPNAGGKFQLSNKLDYVFLKRVLELDTTDPSNPIWKQSNTNPYDAAYPYTHGWALVASSEGDTWTTLGVGELANYNATTGELPVTDENKYFKPAGFFDIKTSAMTVKAVYEPGTGLVENGAYTPVGKETYLRYGNIASNKGSTYAIGFNYARIDDVGYGVGRMRDPVLRLQYTPDEGGEEGTSYFLRGDLENTDVISTEITPPATILSVDYVLVDKYKVNFIVGTPRSTQGNILGVPTSFDYENFAIKSREGSKGFVLTATMNGVLDAATSVVKAEKAGNASEISTLTSTFNSFVSQDTIADMNLRYDGAGTAITGTTLGNARTFILDAARKAYEAGSIENGIVKLSWHQLQYHFANIDASAYPTLKGGVFDEGGNLLPDSTVMAQKYTWCKLMDGCAVGDAGDGAIVDLGSLLSAAYEVYINGGSSDAFELLPMDFVEGQFFRSDMKGSKYASVPIFKAVLANAVQALTKPGTPYAGGVNLDNVTWHEAQYALLNSAYLADASIDKTTLWWSDGSKLTYPAVVGSVSGDITSLLELAWRGYLEGYHSDYLKGLDELGLGQETDHVSNFWLWLRQNDNGQVYTGVTAFKTALERAVGALQSAGKSYADLSTITWRELQYAMINGTYVKDDILAGWETSGILNYWWFDGGKKELKSLADLLKAVVDAKGDMTAVEVSENFVTSVITMRSDFKGTEYTALTMDRFKIHMSELYGLYKENLTKQSKNQIQYYLIHSAAASEAYIANNEANAYYWWFSGEGSPVVFTMPAPGTAPVDYLDKMVKELAEAAYRYGLNGNKHAFDNLSAGNISGVLRLYAAADASAETLADLTEYTSKQSFIDAMGQMAADAIDATAEKNIYKQPSFSWNQAQYYILPGGGFLEEGHVDLPDDSVYWWHYKDSKNDKQKTPLDELFEYMTGYADNPTDGTSLEDWLTLDKVNDDLSFRAKPAFGSNVILYTQSTLTSRVWPRIEALAIVAKQAGNPYWDGTKYTMTWYQVQYYLLNYSAANEAAALVDADFAFSKVHSSWKVPEWATATVIVALSDDFALKLPTAEMTIEEQLDALTLQMEALTKRIKEDPSAAEMYSEQIARLLEAVRALEALLGTVPPETEKPEVPPTEGGETNPGENPEVPPTEGGGTKPEEKPEIPPTEGGETDPGTEPEIPPTEGGGTKPEEKPEMPPAEGGGTETGDGQTSSAPPPQGSTAGAEVADGVRTASVPMVLTGGVAAKRSRLYRINTGGAIPLLFWDSGGTKPTPLWGLGPKEATASAWQGNFVAIKQGLSYWMIKNSVPQAADNPRPTQSRTRNWEERIYA